jgi:hypothetical protein
MESGMGIVMRALLPFLSAGAILSVTSLAIAQDASRDRNDLDTTAGRSVFQNAPLADPQVFSSTPRITPTSRRFAVDPPPPTGEASADRNQLDRAAGRPVFQSAPSSFVPNPKREQSAGPRQHSVRVVLPSPYRQDTEVADCLRSRKKLFVEGEGWIVRRVTTCR